MFLLHRQLIALTLVFLPGNPVFKSWCFIFSVLVYSTYIIIVSPYNTPEQNKDERFNLLCVYFICIHLLFFTDFVVEATDRYTLGYSIIGFLLFNVLWNITFLMIHAIQGIIKKVKNCCLFTKHTFDGTNSRRAKAKKKKEEKAYQARKKAREEATERARKDIEMYEFLEKLEKAGVNKKQLAEYLKNGRKKTVERELNDLSEISEEEKVPH